MTDLHLDRLPESQRRLWLSLKDLNLKDFTLYGGTAIAMRLGHRVSVDFDFFSASAFRPSDLRRELGLLGESVVRVLQEEPNTYSFLALAEKSSEPVKLSFFGNLAFGRVDSPSVASNGIAIAALADLFATKLAALFNRVEAKDYVDIAALITSGISLEKGISFMKAIHPTANPAIIAKTLSWFEGGDLDRLDRKTKDTLCQAASGLGPIPPPPPTRPIGSG